MAEALLDNKIVRAIEREDYQSCAVYKSDDEVAKAVIVVAALFGVGSQWTAVYRVLVDFCGWEDDIVAFCKHMGRLLKDVKLTYPCNYQAIQKPLASNSILRKDYQTWKNYRIPEGDRVFPRQLYIADELLKILSINA